LTPEPITALTKNIVLPDPSRYKDPEDWHDPMLYGMLSHGLGTDSDYYAKEIAKVLSYKDSKLEPEFLGFTSTYRHLALMIPLHFTIIDFGCNHACQAFYFRQHKKYIGIDASIPLEYRLNTPNSEHHLIGGREFITQMFPGATYPQFAISNYVPSDELNLLIRARFQDLYVFYPKSHMPTRS